MKTVMLEELPPEAQDVLEDWLCAKTPLALERVGHLRGEMDYLGVDDDIVFEMTPQEEDELIEVMRQGKEDIAAGRCIPFEEVERLYMERRWKAAK